MLISFSRSEDRSVRYVAEENIELLHEKPRAGGLMELAGRYFKRWDEAEKKFASNVLDAYPDD